MDPPKVNNTQPCNSTAPFRFLVLLLYWPSKIVCSSNYAKLRIMHNSRNVKWLISVKNLLKQKLGKSQKPRNFSQNFNFPPIDHCFTFEWMKFRVGRQIEQSTLNLDSFQENWTIVSLLVNCLDSKESNFNFKSVWGLESKTKRVEVDSFKECFKDKIYIVNFFFFYLQVFRYIPKKKV